jgi:hypothetical protein
VRHGEAEPSADATGAQLRAAPRNARLVPALVLVALGATAGSLGHGPPVALVTAVGTYQPFPYLLPAVALRAGCSPPTALRLGRAAQALIVLALLAIAVFALYDAESPLVSLLGLLLAVTN